MHTQNLAWRSYCRGRGDARKRGVETTTTTRETSEPMNTIPTTRSLRASDRSRYLFAELEHAQRRLLEMQLGVPTTAAPRRKGMLSQIDHR